MSKDYKTQTRLDGATCVDRAVERLQMFEPDDGYILCFSGGKDSVVLKALADRAGVEYTAKYNITTIDPPPVMRFMHKHYPEVEWVKPNGGLSFAKQVAKRGLPLRQSRWCCEEFKESTFEGRVKLLGVREAEGRISGTVKLTRICYRTGEKAIQPIYDWSDSELWGYISQHDLPYCKLYDEGWDRIGCVCCPYASKKERMKNMERWPAMFEAIRRAVHERWENYWVATDSPVADRFDGPDHMFEWWMDGTEKYPELEEIVTDEQERLWQ